MFVTTNRQQIIDRLQREIDQIERKPDRREGFAGTGRSEIDAMLPGQGFPRGELSELSGGPASGKTGLALSAMASAMGAKGLAAFIDGRQELYPPGAKAFGVDLSRLLIVRPGFSGRQGLWAAELLLSSGAFEMVTIDVALQGERPDRAEAMMRRLRAAAEKGGAVALWLGEPRRAYRVPAAVRLDLESLKSVSSAPLMVGSGHAA